MADSVLVDDDDARENRFAYLLQPIRDLAENWSIDIAKELEEYLDELEHISFKFDDPNFAAQRTLNFAEAALLIQGSACIYSKKVEYLYGLLNQTLDLIVTKKKKAAEKADSQEGDAQEQAEEEPEFLALDDILQESDNVDLVERTPGDGRKAKKNSVVEEVEGEPRFKINTAFVHKSGALLVEPDNDRLDETLQEHAAAANKSHLSVLVAGDREDEEEEEEEDEHDNGGDLGGEDDDVAMWDAPAPPRASAPNTPGKANASLSLRGKSAAALSLALANASAAVLPKEEDPWRLLDPHVPSANETKRPFKKKNTCRPPVSLLQKEQAAPAAPAEKTAINFRVPTWADLGYLYAAEQKRRLASRKKDREAGQAVRRSKLVPNFVLSEGAAVDDEDEEEANAINGLYGDGAAAASDDEEAEELVGIVREAGKGGEPLLSYEELCRKQIDAYIATAQQYQQETALSKRVAEWSSKLEPLLEEQEKHTVFDVHEYGTQVVTKLKAAKKKEAVHLKDLLGSEDEPTNYNACRVFVTALHLINNGNIEPIIAKDGVMTFKYLSDKPMESDMIGAFGEVVPAAGTKQKGKKKQMQEAQEEDEEKELETEKVKKQKEKEGKKQKRAAMDKRVSFAPDSSPVDEEEEADKGKKKAKKPKEKVAEKEEKEKQDEIEPIELPIHKEIHSKAPPPQKAKEKEEKEGAEDVPVAKKQKSKAAETQPPRPKRKEQGEEEKAAAVISASLYEQEKENTAAGAKKKAGGGAALSKKMKGLSVR